MKLRVTLTSLLCLVALPFVGVSAQDSTATVHQPLHPQRGEIGVVVGADPVLNFLGNMFNGNTKNKFDWGTQTYTLGVRYYLTDNMAVRGACQFNNGKPSFTSTLYLVEDDAAKAADPKSTKRINDRVVKYENNYSISGGIMFFRGKRKLRGFYGGDVTYGFSRESTTYTYGNQMTAANPSPTTAAPGQGSSKPRLLEERPSFKHTFGIVGFGGVEYFICPQISLGFEAGIVLSAEIEGQKTEVYERVDNGKRIQYNETKNGGGNTLTFNTMNPLRGSLFLTFHF